MVMLKKIFVVVLFFISSQSFAQKVTVLASVDSSNYLVGDFVNYTLEVRAEKDVQVINPFFRDSLKNVEVIKEFQPVIKEDEKAKTTFYKYIISYYDSAEITISPVAVQYKTKKDTILHSALSNPVTFSVSTVEVVPQQDIKDVKSPLTIPLDWKIILLWILIAAVLIAAAVYLYKRYKKKKGELPVKKEIIKIPAHIVALSELDELEKKQLWQKGKIKEYHSEITGIIRKYFEERFNLPALELTTSETLKLLGKNSEALVILETTSKFLNNADMVKFAKFIPLDSVNEEMMKQAREIVNSTIKKEIEPEQSREEAA